MHVYIVHTHPYFTLQDVSQNCITNQILFSFCVTFTATFLRWGSVCNIFGIVYLKQKSYWLRLYSLFINNAMHIGDPQNSLNRWCNCVNSVRPSQTTFCLQCMSCYLRKISIVRPKLNLCIFIQMCSPFYSYQRGIPLCIALVYPLIRSVKNTAQSHFNDFTTLRWSQRHRL